MIKTNIWVEGIADQKFLADVLKMWFGFSLDKKFEFRDASGEVVLRISKGDGVSTFSTGDGWEKIKQSFEENEARGTKNLIIIDADEDFDKRKKQVVETVVEVNFDSDADLFLWPDHHPHAEKGDLEKLLEQIIHPEHQPIFNCWDNYENCLRGYSDKKYTTPARKTKIYAYLEALLGETRNEKEKIKERERDYSNSAHWNLDHTKEPLKPLYEFLKKHLVP
ncbi:MAG TPA: hypothetical protein PK914_10730 [Smithellaceae bacterium]|nr:hypothetical protein [Smithellaceae bacterium]